MSHELATFTGWPATAPGAPLERHSYDPGPLGAEEARRSRQEGFEFTVREVTFLDRTEQHWERDQMGAVVTDVTSGGGAPGHRDGSGRGEGSGGCPAIR